MIERYMAARQLHSHLVGNLDVDDPVVNDILEQGWLVPLPSRDEEGRKILLTCPGKLDPSKYTVAEIAKSFSIVFETLMDDEENQINGYTYINDGSGFLMGHISLFSSSDIRRLAKSTEYCTPIRYKAVHFINVPQFANKIFKFFIENLNKKFKLRITVHSNLEDFRKHFSSKVLPAEYGGETPLKDIIAQFKQDIKKKREAIAALEKMEIDISKTSKADFKDEVKTMAETFRYLEFD